jgi:hypothetical protein
MVDHTEDLNKKRLARYPIQVRNIKRLRRQVSGLNRCIAGHKEHSERLFKTLTEWTKMYMVNPPKPNTGIIYVTGAICFCLGVIVGMR